MSFKNLKIATKIILMNSVMLFILAGSLIFISSQLNESSSIINQQKDILLRLAVVNEAKVEFESFRIWATDLTVSWQNESVTNAEEAKDRFNELLSEIDYVDKSVIDSIVQLTDDYMEVMMSALDAYVDENRVLGNSILHDSRKITSAIESWLTDISNEANKTAEQAGFSVVEANSYTMKVTWAMLLFAVVVGVAISWLFPKTISTPLNKVVYLTTVMNEEFRNFTEVVNAIANNDLTKKIHNSKIERIGIESADEIGVLVKSIEDTLEAKEEIGGSLEKMATNLAGMVTQITENASKLGIASSDISSNSNEISKGVLEQSDQISQISGAIEEMNTTIMESAKNSSEATGASKNASNMAKDGGDIVNGTISGMKKISEVVSQSSESIVKLEHSAKQIGEIISVIDEIADQTNLLALNAAIEAARAGDQGRGFAVVADEVRVLAEKTGKATGEIASMIKGIQKETDDAVRGMESGIEEIDKGRELTDKAGMSLNEIVEMTQNVMDVIQQIATASNEQSVASEEISKVVDRISTVTMSTAEGAEHSSKAANELEGKAEELKMLVRKFKL